MYIIKKTRGIFTEKQIAKQKIFRYASPNFFLTKANRITKILFKQIQQTCEYRFYKYHQIDSFNDFFLFQTDAKQWHFDYGIFIICTIASNMHIKPTQFQKSIINLGDIVYLDQNDLHRTPEQKHIGWRYFLRIECSNYKPSYMNMLDKKEISSP